jgi:hypothetical protein
MLSDLRPARWRPHEEERRDRDHRHEADHEQATFALLPNVGHDALPRFLRRSGRDDTLPNSPQVHSELALHAE